MILEMITQLLYGDLIEIIEIKDSWVNIKKILQTIYKPNYQIY